jgi:hypothetical protein
MDRGAWGPSSCRVAYVRQVTFLELIRYVPSSRQGWPGYFDRCDSRTVSSVTVRAAQVNLIL